jgi:hypothetical protein
VALLLYFESYRCSFTICRLLKSYDKPVCQRTSSVQIFSLLIFHMFVAYSDLLSFFSYWDRLCLSICYFRCLDDRHGLSVVHFQASVDMFRCENIPKSFLTRPSMLQFIISVLLCMTGIRIRPLRAVDRGGPPVSAAVGSRSA